MKDTNFMRQICSNFAESAAKQDQVIGIAILQHRGIYESFPLKYGLDRRAPTSGAVLPLPFGIITENNGQKSSILTESGLKTKDSNIRYSYLVAECKVDLELLKGVIDGEAPTLEEPALVLVLGVGSRSHENGTESSFSFEVMDEESRRNVKQLAFALIVENSQLPSAVKPGHTIRNVVLCTIL